MRIKIVVLTAGLLIGTGAAVATPAVAAPTHALIQGSGSSWASNEVDQWAADVGETGLQVDYTGSGSAQGRADFAHGLTDFAVTDLPYSDADPVNGTEDSSQGRAFAYAPLVGGGTSFPYQLRAGGKAVTDLRLSGATLAGIFTGRITNWASKAIRADNNGRILPNLPIKPVVHSEGSAVSFHVSEYFTHEYRADWTRLAGSAAPTAYWPRLRGAVTRAGSDAVVEYVSSKAGNGSIGMDEFTFALAKNLPVAKVRNRAGYFVGPNPGNVSIALRRAVPTATGPADLGPVFTGRDPRTYPLSSYSYAVIPTGSTDARMTTARRQTLVDFVHYSVCQGQSVAGPLGYAPLTLNLVKAALKTVAALHDADPDVDIRNRGVSNCDNPTFDPADPSKDRLGATVAQPAACDRDGHGPCLRSEQPSTLSLRGGARIHRGAKRTLAGLVRASGIPVEGAAITVYAATRSSGWKRLVTVHAAVDGRFHLTVRPATTTRYQARFPGTRSFGRATSGTVVVTVSAHR